MNSVLGGVRAAALAAPLIATPGVVPAQDAGRLIMRARQRIEALDTDSARSLLRRALNPASGAGSAERLRGLVLWTVSGTCTATCRVSLKRCARLTVDGVLWESPRREVTPGMDLVEARARGYVTLRVVILVQLREEHARQREARARENAERRADAPIRVRVAEVRP